MRASIFINYLNLSQQWILETNVALTWNPTTSRTLTLYQYFTVNRSENTKSPNLELEIEFAFAIMIYPSGKVINHNLRTKFFEIFAIATKKPPTYTIKDEQEEVIRGKIYEKELIRVIWVWIHLQSNWFPTNIHNSSQTTRSVHLQNSCRSNWICTDNGRWQFPRFLTYQCTKTFQRGHLCFTMRNSAKQQRLTILNPDWIPQNLILWKLWTLSYKRETKTETLASQSKLGGNAKSKGVSGEQRRESSNF